LGSSKKTLPMYIKNKSPAFSCLYSGKLQASNLASKYGTP
jgi:hypothetical protein